MFTGLVEASLPVRRVERRGAGLRVAVGSPGWEGEPRPGQSLCLSGCCLSVAAGADPRTGAEVPPQSPGADLLFDLSAETLERTWFGDLATGRRLHVERALRLSDRLDGHLVTGHVDGVGVVTAVADSQDGGRRLEVEVPAAFERWLVDKGSVAVDGVSLTVVAPRGRRFSVALVPVTLERTTLGELAPGLRVNLEADPIGKWVERLGRA